MEIIEMKKVVETRLPYLTTDIVDDKLTFPCMVEPKIDGVRGVYLSNDIGFTTRTLKRFANKYIDKLFNDPLLLGLDGELTVGPITAENVLNLTTSAVNSEDGEPTTVWNLFDYITDETSELGYYERWLRLTVRVNHINSITDKYKDLLTVVPFQVVYSIGEFYVVEAAYLRQGYEGIIYRSFEGKYKSGRATVKENSFLRKKRFVTDEAVVVSIGEANENTNVKETNELGKSFRSSVKANMKPKGAVGKLFCKDVKTGNVIEVGPGKMKHTERVYYFENQDKLIGKYISYKHFPRGVKNKPRFPTFEYIRDSNDIVEVN
jgi:DNA ligase-1